MKNLIELNLYGLIGSSLYLFNRVEGWTDDLTKLTDITRCLLHQGNTYTPNLNLKDTNAFVWNGLRTLALSFAFAILISYNFILLERINMFISILCHMLQQILIEIGHFSLLITIEGKFISVYPFCQVGFCSLTIIYYNITLINIIKFPINFDQFSVCSSLLTSEESF